MHYSVFAYGTLMFPDIAALVTGESPRRRPARLIDHARHALRDRPCPGAVPCRGRSIEGVILSGLSAAALARVDDFEGELYRRRPVRVYAGDAGDCAALVYLVRPRWRPLLLARPWDGDSFRRHWHDRYLQRLGAEFGRSAGQGRRHSRAGAGP